MKITIAYIEEPPFGWTDAGGSPCGADVELADVVLRALGVTDIEHRLTTFAELLPGARDGRWDVNVPLFVTPERSETVDFSVPVWAIGDGLLVRAGNPKALDSYRAVAAQADTRLGIITGQVQQRSALAAGVRDEQIVLFDEQADAIDALHAGRIDAYASTALGNRIVAERIGRSRVDAVAQAADDPHPRALAGAFSFGKHNRALRDAFDRQLRQYLGSADHRQRMAKYGFTASEIDPVVVAR